MTPNQAKVKEFHIVMGMKDNDHPTLVDGETAGLRIAVIAEEFNELIKAIAKEDLVEIADALGDLEYVIHGCSNAYGIDMEPIFNEIHETNMKKVDPETGTVRYREDGKVLKPKGWKKPDIKPLLDAQAVKEPLHLTADDQLTKVQCGSCGTDIWVGYVAEDLIYFCSNCAEVLPR